jgi:hypothetical protein
MHFELEVRCSKAVVLDKIRQNREEHAAIVQEARQGFLDRARVALTGKLALLEQGKLTSLSVNLAPPQNYTSEYDTIIQMLELHTEPEIVLGAREVRMFIEDKWDWTNAFYATNAVYSNSALTKRAELEGESP